MAPSFHPKPRCLPLAFVLTHWVQGQSAGKAAGTRVLATGCQLRLLGCGLPPPALLVPCKIDFYFKHLHLPLAAHLSAHPACFPVIMIGCVESHSHAIPCATAAPGEKASASPEMMPFSSCLVRKGETPITGCPSAKLSIFIAVFGRAGKSLWLIVLPHPPTWQMKQPGLREKAGLGREHTANQGQSWH